MGRRVDEKCIEFVSKFLIGKYPEKSGFNVVTSSTEDHGIDILIRNTSNVIGRLEVKTKKKKFKEFGISTTGKNMFFGLVPEISRDIVQLSNDWKKPTQAQIEAAKRDENEKCEILRLFCLNAASGCDFDVEKSKWFKMYSDPTSMLCVVFSDGILLFPHSELLEAQDRYGYIFTEKAKCFSHYSKYWQFKVFINIDKGYFFKCEVPENIFN